MQKKRSYQHLIACVCARVRMCVCVCLCIWMCVNSEPLHGFIWCFLLIPYNNPVFDFSLCFLSVVTESELCFVSQYGTERIACWIFMEFGLRLTNIMGKVTLKYRNAWIHTGHASLAVVLECRILMIIGLNLCNVMGKAPLKYWNTWVYTSHASII